MVMNITNETIVGDIVKANYQTARIFDDYRIDYCCGGNISVGNACAAEGIESDELIGRLESTLAHEDSISRYLENLPLSALCDYIIETHHNYIRDRVPFILSKLQKLCEVHGEHHPELFQVKEMFDAASANLMTHMEKEESVLFPVIRKLVQTKLEGKLTADEGTHTDSSVKELMDEHQQEGDRFKEMSKITNNFEVPPDGCNTFEVTYRSLAEFVKDLHRHIHLENNILFPGSLSLEVALREKQ